MVTDPTFFILLLIVITLTAGTSFLMWLGEKITEHGIGNGISLIIFAGIVAEFPVGIVQTVQTVGEGGISIFSLLVLAVLFVVIVAAVVMVQEGQRRIPVQYAKGLWAGACTAASRRTSRCESTMPASSR